MVESSFQRTIEVDFTLSAAADVSLSWDFL